MKKLFAVIIVIIILFVCSSIMVACHKDNNGALEPLVGEWHTDSISYSVLTTSDEVGKRIKEEWLSNKNYFRITSDMKLHVVDGDGNICTTYTLAVENKLTENEIIVLKATNNDVRYGKMSIIWYYNENKLQALYENSYQKFDGTIWLSK